MSCEIHFRIDEIREKKQQHQPKLFRIQFKEERKKEKKWWFTFNWDSIRYTSQKPYRNVCGRNSTNIEEKKAAIIRRIKILTKIHTTAHAHTKCTNTPTQWVEWMKIFPPSQVKKIVYIKMLVQRSNRKIRSLRPTFICCCLFPFDKNGNYWSIRTITKLENSVFRYGDW